MVTEKARRNLALGESWATAVLSSVVPWPSSISWRSERFFKIWSAAEPPTAAWFCVWYKFPPVAAAFASTTRKGNRRPRGVTWGSLIRLEVSCRSTRNLRAMLRPFLDTRAFAKFSSDKPTHISGRGSLSLNMGMVGSAGLIEGDLLRLSVVVLPGTICCDRSRFRGMVERGL